MHFNSKIAGSYWDENAGKWTVKVIQTMPDGQIREFEDTCDVLLQCTGVLSTPKLPDVEGLETFKGKASGIPDSRC
jgi:cation diffusion facilitator CzcD-associated flavoprotein CzcO